MRLLILGASGGTGRQLTSQAVEHGHRVTAFVRSPDKLDHGSGVRVVRGDPLKTDWLASALPGHDAVLSAIGPRPRDALLSRAPSPTPRVPPSRR